jgi:hypothetical protein
MAKISADGASGGGQLPVPDDAFIREDGVITAPPTAGGGSGTVTSVTAADASIMVSGTDTVAPTLATGTLDVVAMQHPPAGSVPMNSQKFTGLANGSSATDSAAFGQIPVADSVAADIQPAQQSAAAGSNGKWADSGHVHPPGSSFLCTPTSVAPSSQTGISVTGTTMAVFAPAATTVASGSNGGEISQIATWSSPSPGVLDVATTAAWPASGSITVAASGSTTAVVTYTGVSGNSLTGCQYVSGSASGTVSTGGAVTLTTSAFTTGAFTAPESGLVLVTFSAILSQATPSYPWALGLAEHGGVSPILGNVVMGQFQSSTLYMPAVAQFLIPVTPNGSYNLDLLGAIMSGGTGLKVNLWGQSTTTPSFTQSVAGAPAIMTVQAV